MKTLLIEPVSSVRGVLRKTLESRGHEVTLSNDAESAYAACSGESFPLVVLDLELPETDGLAVCRRLRALPNMKSTVILAVASVEVHRNLEAVLAAGADDCMVRPMTLSVVNLRFAVAEGRSRDLAQRDESAQLLAEKTLHLDNILRYSAYSIATTDLDFRITYYNPKAEEVFGYRAEEVIGKTVQEMHTREKVPPERFERAIEIVRREGQYAYTFAKPGPNGTQYINTLISGLYTPEGELAGFVSFAHDVTPQKRAELALEEARDQLELRVQQRTAELTEVNRRLEAELGERARAEEAVRKEQRLLRSLLDVHERERKLAAYEIHDGFAQHLVGALMHFEAFAQKEHVSLDGPRNEFALGRRLLQNSVDDARRLISGLRPPILDEGGIGPAIEYLVSEIQEAGDLDVDCHLEIPFDRLAPVLETAIFRIVQEALANVRQHAKTRKARVRLQQTDGRIHLEIRDWGAGFDPAAIPENHYGLQGIRERARLLGGRATIDATMGKGSRITVELPVSLGTGEGPDDGSEGSPPANLEPAPSVSGAGAKPAR
jgi:PAS domain S-box-containing protein